MMALQRRKVLAFALVLMTTLALVITIGNTHIPTAKAWGGPGTCQVTSSIQSNFNGTPISAGDSIWFTSVLKVHGLPAGQTTTLTFENQTITFNGQTYDVPIGQVVFDSNATTATTTTPGFWLTTVPPNVSGNTFLSGFTFVVPAGGLPSGINPVTWSGLFDLPTNASLTVNWQWSAAVYTNFTDAYDQLGVKATDDNHFAPYQNSDHAGTPENFKSFVTGGARGGGGSNFTGSLSATQSAACP